MKKLQKFFSSPKRTVVTIACIIAILVLLGTGAVFAMSTIAKSSSIGAENAENFAFADAGIDPASVGSVRTEFDYEQGQFVYEVEFVANNSEYEYWIQASDGTIVKKQVEVRTQEGSNAVPAEEISLDEARKIALDDAGLSAEDVTFTSEALDVDDGVSVYDIDFFTDHTEYEYEIHAVTGAIYSKSKENLVTQEPPESTPRQESSKEDTEDRYIGIDKAKSIALSHAGVSDVTYTKAKLDTDDGQVVYEIEFLKDGMEYEYTLRATDGSILEYDSEWDD